MEEIKRVYITALPEWNPEGVIAVFTFFYSTDPAAMAWLKYGSVEEMSELFKAAGIEVIDTR